VALVLADRVQQTGTANTTVSFTLSGSVTGFQSFTAGVGNGNTTYYAATDTSGNWETGLGTFSTTGPTLTRTTVYQSSNSNAAVTFSGTVTVFVSYVANRAIYEDESGNASALGTIASGVWQGTAIGLAYGGTGSASAPAAMANLVGFTTTATAAGTTVLTNASSYYQLFTGTTTQTITLPVTSTLAQGWSYHIVNNSTGNLTVNSSGGNLVLTVIPGTTIMVTCILTSGTTAASWEAGYTDFSTATGTGSVVLSASPTVTNPTFTGFVETVFAVTGTTPALTPTNGTIQTWTLSGASTPTSGTWTDGASMTLHITAGANSITWTSATFGTGGVKWVGASAPGSPPTLSSTAISIIELWEVSSQVYGAFVGIA
jgi:hypothetical protein